MVLSLYATSDVAPDRKPWLPTRTCTKHCCCYSTQRVFHFVDYTWYLYLALPHSSSLYILFNFSFPSYSFSFFLCIILPLIFLLLCLFLLHFSNIFTSPHLCLFFYPRLFCSILFLLLLSFVQCLFSAC